MRSLFLKLTLAFLLIALIGATLTAVFIQRRTRTAFDRFLFDQQKDAVMDVLTEHYAQHGNWDDLAKEVDQILFPPFVKPFPVAPPNAHGFESQRYPFVVVDAQGFIVYGSTIWMEQPISPEILERGEPLVVEGETVGYLLNARISPQWERNSPQGSFLATINQAMIFATLSAFGVALILSALLARSLTSPLRELSAATEKVTQGALGYTVTVRTKDEIGQLGQSFNRMSTELARINALRKQMTADIAHELRTPLSVLLGYTESLSDGKLQGTSQIYTTMHEMTRHLSHLVDDLRTLSLAEAGELSFNFQNLNLPTLLERLAQVYRPKAAEKDITMHVDYQPSVRQIHADLDRLIQVLDNLLSNALRHTPEGGAVWLSAKDQGSDVVVCVKDSGQGIPPEELPFIFDRFYRGDRSRTPSGSTGLGLSIAKSLTEAMGGVIEIQSQWGEGSTFCLRFPAVENVSANSQC